MGRLWVDWIQGEGQEDQKLDFGEPTLRCLLDIRKSYLSGNWVCKPIIWVKSMSYRYKYSLEEAAAGNSFHF